MREVVMVVKFLGKIRQLPSPAFFWKCCWTALSKKIFPTAELSLLPLYCAPTYQLFYEPWAFQTVILNLGKQNKSVASQDTCVLSKSWCKFHRDAGTISVVGQKAKPAVSEGRAGCVCALPLDRGHFPGVGGSSCAETPREGAESLGGTGIPGYPAETCRTLKPVGWCQFPWS